MTKQVKVLEELGLPKEKIAKIICKAYDVTVSDQRGQKSSAQPAIASQDKPQQELVMSEPKKLFASMEMDNLH